MTGLSRRRSRVRVPSLPLFTHCVVIRVPGLLRSSGDDSGDPLEPPKPSNFESVKQEVLRLASIADPTERLLEVAAVIGESLSDLGVQPVVVGGLALAYWSDNDEFITGDIDVLVPRVPELPVRLQALGFEQRGRDWILPGHDVSFESPGEVLEPGDEGEWAELAVADE